MTYNRSGEEWHGIAIGEDKMCVFKTTPVLEEVAKLRRFEVLQCTEPAGVLQACYTDNIGNDWKPFLGDFQLRKYVVFIIVIPNIYEN